MSTKPTSWIATTAFEKQVTLGRLRVKARMAKGNGVMGRLGGGWAWKLGILAAKTDVVLELFVMSVRFTWMKREDERQLRHLLDTTVNLANATQRDAAHYQREAVKIRQAMNRHEARRATPRRP